MKIEGICELGRIASISFGYDQFLERWELLRGFVGGIDVSA